jgi:murein L,D-transpeptidase YcbB/YkuD
MMKIVSQIRESLFLYGYVLYRGAQDMIWLFNRDLYVLVDIFRALVSKKALYVVLLIVCYNKIVLAQELDSGLNAPQASPVEMLLSHYFTKQAPYLNDEGVTITPKQAYRSKYINGSRTISNAVADLYVGKNSTQLWQHESARKMVVEQLKKLSDDGLNPADYQVDLLEQWSSSQQLPPDQELHYSASLLRALFHLTRGKVNEKGNAPVWNFSLNDFPETLQRELLQGDFSASNIETFFEQARPSQAEYTHLRDAYVRLRDGQDNQRYPQLLTHKVLKPCERSIDVLRLRERLRITGEYTVTDPEAMAGSAKLCLSQQRQKSLIQAKRTREQAYEQWQEAKYRAEQEGNYFSEPEPEPWSEADELRHRANVESNLDDVYDEELVRAVKHFQQENLLKVDGIIGGATRRALNISPSDRLDQIKINLDRARWRLHRMQKHMVLVDLAGFRVRYYVDGRIDFESRVQIGMAYRHSPVIHSSITHVTLNPSWIVPPTILRKDILPKFRADPSYLAKNRLKAYDTNGRQVDPHSVNWNSPGSFRLRQSPGPKGALGLAAIRFPNDHAIYLHDTPHQKLFDTDQRATSSGCIRVENAMELVARLLADTPEWQPDSIQKTIGAGKTKNARLKSTIPILIAYWTVDAVSPTQLIFKEDVYKRDATMIAAFNQSH